VKFYSTSDPTHQVSAREAVRLGLAPDGGLYMPVQISPLPSSFWSSIRARSYEELALEMMHPFFGEGLSRESLYGIIQKVCQIPIRLVRLGDVHLVELFHGPTHAFKDVGARFMAELLRAYQEYEDMELHILVATSGDTGGAVAAAFHGQEGIRVSILYPLGGVSAVQEKQLTTWGDNIHALRINGSFDDCQRLVKTAFSDPVVTNHTRLSSANSINIGRWLPQSIYYSEAYRQLSTESQTTTIAVPCGNAGNISAGMVAEQLGLPVDRWIVCSNANDVLPTYLSTGHYQPKRSIRTLANAMDVGDPSNFVRMKILGGSTWNHVKERMEGHVVHDEEIIHSIQDTYQQYQYLLDPHTATGWAGMHHFEGSRNRSSRLVMSTAHPSKFEEIMVRALGFSTEPAPHLKRVQQLPGSWISMEPTYPQFREYLMG